MFSKSNILCSSVLQGAQRVSFTVHHAPSPSVSCPAASLCTWARTPYRARPNPGPFGPGHFHELDQNLQAWIFLEFCPALGWWDGGLPADEETYRCDSDMDSLGKRGGVGPPCLFWLFRPSHPVIFYRSKKKKVHALYHIRLPTQILCSTSQHSLILFKSRKH